MIYEWKIKNLYPIPAEKAAEELERIYTEYGELNPSDIVQESTPEDAPLHPCFEWDNEKAAEKYREHQAGQIVRSIVTVVETENTDFITRAFAHVESAYHPIKVVVSSEDKLQELLETALAELRAFQLKYHTLTELSGVFSEIENLRGVEHEKREASKRGIGTGHNVESRTASTAGA